MIIAAVARNGVIGSGGGIPWHIPEDLERFRSLTAAPGACVIMGRKTWESIPARDGQKLPGRTVLVLSRSAAADAALPPRAEPAGKAAEQTRSGVPRFFSGLEAALEYARPRYRRVYIAGGESVYREALPFARALLITRVDAAPEGDRFFPLDLDGAPGWVLCREKSRRLKKSPRREEPRLREEPGAGFSFTVWERA